MNQTLNFEAEPFETDFESAQTGFGTLEFDDLEWETPTDRTSRAYVRWLQLSLNQVLGLQLAADGFLGPQSRSAIRVFQQRAGLTADGIAGPKTEAALIRAGASAPTGAANPLPSSGHCPTRPAFVNCPSSGGQASETLAGFAVDSSRLNASDHIAKLRKVASRVNVSQVSSRPIRRILIAGHTDLDGSDEYNFQLGKRRAEEVLKELCTRLEEAKSGLAAKVRFELTSCGERQQKGTPALSRRVEIFLFAQTVTPPVPAQPQPAAQCGRVLIWMNAFIPRDIPGLTLRVPGSGPHAGKTMIPGPISRVSDCFLTDQRSFNSSPGASSRMHSEVEIDLAPPRLVRQAHRCHSTIEVDCEDGDRECEATAATGRMRFANFRTAFPSPFTTFTISVDLDGQANNPCFTGSPDIEYNGKIQISVSPRAAIVLVEFSGFIGSFPAFEMHAAMNGVVRPLFMRNPAPGATPADLFAGANRPVSGRVSFQCLPTAVGSAGELARLRESASVWLS